MKAAYSAKELDALQLPVLPSTANGIYRKADRENWSFYWQAERGGQIKMYRAYLLPEAIRQAILGQEEINALIPISGSANLPAIIGNGIVGAAQAGKANLKASLVRLYMQALSAATWGHKEQARDNFMAAYNSGSAWPELYKELGALSWKTVENWKTKLKKTCGDSLQLADRRGKKRGERSITPLQAQIILAFVRQPKGKSLPKSEIIRFSRDVMRGKGIDDLSDATYRRFLDDWVAVNYDEWTWWREGDKGLQDKCMYWIERDYDRINVGDILVADGHVLNFLIINPWTGKAQRMMLVLFFDMKSSMPCGWEILPTENTASISAALRRSIIRLGMAPKIVYLDNGRAFKGHYFTGTDFEQTELPGLYDSLGIKLIIAKPYHGQSKTIERFFKTFGELERMSPSFIGTAIDSKPAHLNRGEKLHRSINDKIGGFVPTLIDSHRAVAMWFDAYAARPQGPNSHMAGVCPQEMFDAGRGPGVDPNALRILMMKKEERKIYGRGVKVYDKGEFYHHPALHGRKHKVWVRYDMQEQDSVLIYDQRTDEFICEASRAAKVHPAALILGDEKDVALLKEQMEMIGHLRKQTVSHAKAMAAEFVIPEAQRLIADAGFGAPAGQKLLPGVDGGKGNNVRLLPSKPAKLSNEELQQVMKDADEGQRYQRDMEAAQLCADLEDMSEADRYGKLLEMEMGGEELTADWRQFLRVYEQMMPEFEREYWEGQRAALAVLYRQKNPATDEAVAG